MWLGPAIQAPDHKQQPTQRRSTPALTVAGQRCDARPLAVPRGGGGRWRRLGSRLQVCRTEHNKLVIAVAAAASRCRLGAAAAAPSVKRWLLLGMHRLHQTAAAAGCRHAGAVAAEGQQLAVLAAAAISAAAAAS